MIYDNIDQMVSDYLNSRSPDLRDAIVANLAPMVERLARRNAQPGESVEDLTQEAFIGLLNALELYDPDKGTKFTTYATHLIIGQMKHYVRDFSKLIKEPAWLQEQAQRINKIALSLHQTLGREPSHVEIADAVGLTEDNVREIYSRREVFKISSIDSMVDEDNENEYANDVEKLAADDEESLSFEDKATLSSAMKQLKEIEQITLKLFYYDGLNQTEIANKLNISCNYVSHILRQSVQKLRRILTTDELRDRQLMQRHNANYRDAFIIDEQTGVYSGAYLRMRLEEELLRAGRHGTSCSLVSIRLSGLDEFQAFYGEMTMSELLRRFTDLIRSCIRKSDILTRSSDWEFTIIMPHTDSSVASPASRIEQKLHQWRGNTFGQAPSQVSVGVAYAMYPDDGRTVKTLLKISHDRLDRMMQSNAA